MATSASHRQRPIRRFGARFASRHARAGLRAAACFGRRSPVAALVCLPPALLLAPLVACNLALSANASINVRCSSASDCPFEQVCVPPDSGLPRSGTCQAICTADAGDCNTDLTCTPVGPGAVSACLPPSVGPTSSLADATVADAQGSDASATGDTQAEDATMSDGADAPIDAIEEADVVEESDAPSDGEPVPSFVCDGGWQPTTIVLFGGLGYTQSLADTWVFDGGSWSNVANGPDTDDAGGALDAAPDAPPARENATMATACGYAVLAGGVDTNTNETLGDAWLWNGATWQVAPSAPPALSSAAAATLGGTLYLFGGLNSGSMNSTSVPVADLYAWSGGDWPLASQSSASGPAARYGASFANLPGGLILFGGFDTNNASINDAWTWTGTGWLLASDAGPGGVLESPGGRGYAAGASWENSVLVFGGVDSNFDVFGDTAIWNGSIWQDFLPQGTGPPPRYAAAMASLNGQVVLFGGFDSAGNPLGDTWIWSNGSWAAGPSGPPARGGAAMTAY